MANRTDLGKGKVSQPVFMPSAFALFLAQSQPHRASIAIGFPIHSQSQHLGYAMLVPSYALIKA
jgi:hypothetical protein